MRSSIIIPGFLGKGGVDFESKSNQVCNSFLLMLRTLRLKNSLRGTVHFQDLIALKLRKEKETSAMIKDNQSFHQRQILIKMENPLLVLLRMADSNQTHMDKLRFMVPMVEYHVRMSMSKLNDEDSFTLVTELEDDEYEEGPGYDDPPE